MGAFHFLDLYEYVFVHEKDRNIRSQIYLFVYLFLWVCVSLQGLIRECAFVYSSPTGMYFSRDFSSSF